MINWFKRDKKKKKEEEQPAESKAESREELPVEPEPEAEETAAIPETVEEFDYPIPEVEFEETDSEPIEAEPLEPSPLEPSDAEPEVEKNGLFTRLKKGLANTRALLNTRVDHLILGKREIDADVLDDLEEILITSDLGVKTTGRLIKAISEKVGRAELDSANKLKAALKQEITDILTVPAPEIDPTVHKPHVIMVVGVNGVGKTTTIAKLANRWIREGRKVMIVAGDTFRAAAVEQLSIWADRVGADIVKHKTGSDPSAVVFDALHAAESRGTEIVIIDTAGRLHTKVNLMEELKKIQRVADREMPGAPHEVLLVLDATTGQNAVNQARLFNEAVGVHYLAMTKLDGTAKGGVVVAITYELGLPIRYIGIGEGMDDLRDFDPKAFVDAVFS